MNTVKWRRLSIAAAFAVAGSVLFAVIVAVSPDAAEAGRSGSDTTPPGRSDGSPTGTLPAGTTSATLSLTTDEAATCRYSTTAGVAYSRMKDTFSTTGGRSHATAVGGLRDGNTFTFYVRCRDLARNANPDDYAIRFTVQSRDDCGTPSATAHGTWTAAGGASNPPSSGPAGTWAFVPSPSVESASDLVGGLRDGNTFTFYVRCRDLARNANPDDYAIRFTVQSRDDCGTPSATAHGTWTAAGGASNPPSSGPAGTWAFVPSPSVESASPSIVVDTPSR